MVTPPQTPTPTPTNPFSIVPTTPPPTTPVVISTIASTAT